MKEKIKIKIGKIGHLPFKFNDKLIEKWKSDVFEIIDYSKIPVIRKRASIRQGISQVTDEENDYSLGYGYDDSILEELLHGYENGNANFSIWITYVSIEDNFFARRLSSNKIVLSYFKIHEFLEKGFIPVENFLLKEIYEYILVYRKYKNTIPSYKDAPKIPFIHDDTRSCLFDMCVNKADVTFFFNEPNICNECTEKIIHSDYVNTVNVEENYVNRIKKECSKKIKRRIFHKIILLMEENPIKNSILSAIIAILLNLIAAAIYYFFYTK